MRTSTSRVVRGFAALLAFLLLPLASLVIVLPEAQAQSAVTGTADFRNAPQLAPGEYRDRLVTGDSAWYSVVYTNDTPYRFEVTIDTAQPSGVILTTSFVAPTLTTADGPAAVVDGDGVAYPLGHTNVWFLKVTMESSGQAGVEYPIRISVEGVQSAGTEDCGEIADCTLQDEYDAIGIELAKATGQLDGIDPLDTRVSVEREMIGLRDSVESAGQITRPAAEQRLAQAQATMAELCAPNATCDEFPDPPPKTPTIGLIIGWAAVAGGLYAAFKKLKKSRQTEGDDDEFDLDGSEEVLTAPAPEERPPIAL